MFAGISAHQKGRVAAWQFLTQRFDEIYSKIGGVCFFSFSSACCIIANKCFVCSVCV